MIRKLAFALTLISLSFSGVVDALGLGEVKVQSNLNQPLKAQIQLTNVGGLTDAEILPGLATREEFLRAGVDRVYFLSDIRFTVEKNASGEPVIVLTTKKPVREPFLNFLVEIIWPSGRLLREYALLIDPPLFAQDKVIAANTAPTAAPSSSTQSQSPVRSAPAATAQGDNLSVASVSPARGAGAGKETYGPTSSKDTLWDIALEVRPDRGVSPQQVMLAIQDLNPDAFIDNNINKLKAGQVLRLPSKDQIQTRSSSDAVNEVIAQNSALRKPKTKSLASAAKQDTGAPTSAKTNAGDELKLVVSDKNSKASDSAGSDPSGISEAGSAANDEELAITLEKLDKANLENEELTGKMQSLEDQLETLQRLLTLKNDQLAGMQSQMRANDIAEAEAEQNATAEEAAGENLASEAAEALGETEAEGAEGADVAEELVVSETVTDTKLINENGEVVAEQVEVQETVAVVPAQEVARPKPKSKTVSFQDQFFDNLMNNTLYQAGAAAVLILLLIILLFLSRRSASKESELVAQSSAASDEQDLEDYQDSAEHDAEGFYEEPEALEESDEEDFDEEAPVDDSEKEDVIAEADVYIAYGRLDQAAAILEQGISADPVRADYRLKLLQVYKDARLEEAFDRQYSELEAIQDQAALNEAAQIREALKLALEQDARGTAEDASIDSEHLLDEEESQALMQHEDNSFDFDTVEEGAASEESADLSPEIVAEVAEELEGDLDLESEELDIDLDIDLDLDETDAVADEELSLLEGDDQGIDYEPTALELPDDEEVDEIDLGDLEDATSDIESDAELLDLELDDLDLSPEEEEGIDSALGDIDLSEELDQESEIDLGAELEMDELVDGLGDDEILSDADLTEELSSDDLSDDDLGLGEDDGLTEALEDDLALDLDEELDLDADSSSADDLDLEDEAPGASVLDLGDDEDLVVTDETLEEAAEALGDAESFEPELNENEDFDFLEGTDEASTKLDLARAYIDMGDVDGAKEILAEVEQEGSPEQQTQAKELIASIGG